MKKQVLIRIILIGMLHSFLYLWLVPFVVYPRFGDSGFKMTVAVALIISLAVLGSLFMGKRDRVRTGSTLANMSKVLGTLFMEKRDTELGNDDSKQIKTGKENNS